MLTYYTAFEGVIAYSFTRPVKAYKLFYYIWLHALLQILYILHITPTYITG